MKTKDVLFVRIYITEGSHLLKKITNYLQTEIKIKGVSVFRAISGFGESGEHTSSILDLSINLPLTIEFFDTNDKVKIALEYLNTIIKPDHIVIWNATVNDNTN